jgi:hypothetical protein
LGLICAPLVDLIGATGWWWAADQVHVSPAWLGTLWALPFVMGAGILLLTALMHLARGVGHLHALFAKALLVQK